MLHPEQLLEIKITLRYLALMCSSVCGAGGTWLRTDYKTNIIFEWALKRWVMFGDGLEPYSSNARITKLFYQRFFS